MENIASRRNLAAHIYLFAMKTMHAEVVRVDETTYVIRINNAVVPNFL